MTYKIYRLMKENNGSMTLEATMIFPMLLAMIFMMICIGIIVLNVNTYQFVHLTAVERAAFNWDEYDRDFSTGVRQSEYRYGLYEHDTMLMMLNQLIHLNKPISYYNRNLGASEGATFSGDLKQDKLNQMNTYMQKGDRQFTGNMAFELHNFTPRVMVRTEPIRLLLNLTYQSNSSAPVLDATQHIRGVDLLVYYSDKLNKQASDKDSWLQKMKEVLPPS